MKDYSEKIRITSKKETNLIESDDRKELINKSFIDLLNKNNAKSYSH